MKNVESLFKLQLVNLFEDWVSFSRVLLNNLSMINLVCMGLMFKFDDSVNVL